ncbi:MMPL family transporter [Spirochaetota bacterium]
MKGLVRFSINNPKKVLAALIIITLFFGFILYAKFDIETSPTKSFSRNLEVVKFYNLTMKKFSMKDYILIGIENDRKGVFNTETIRYIEDLMARIKKLKIQKKFKSILTGKKESVSVSSTISPTGFMSIINAEDINVDKKKNTVIIGNLTSKARKKAGLIVPENKMGQLPKDNKKLEILIPIIKKELMGNDLLKGTLVSNDGKACAILVPIQKKLDNKIRILRKELYAMINIDKMKEKFSGNDYYFPHNIYNKKLDGENINDEFIKNLVSENKKEVRAFFLELFENMDDDLKDFYAILKTKPVNETYIDNVFKTLEADRIYELKSNNLTYEDMIDEAYKFTIGTIDKFSKDNLEHKLYSVSGISDVGLIYDILSKMANEKKPGNIKVYIAGRPIAEALIERYVVGDMSIFLSITILVIILILYFSFRSKRGIILPIVSVMGTAIWVMAMLLLAGQKFSSGTIPLPTILIAVGSAYIIHFISRYYEETLENGTKDIKQAIMDTTCKLQVAINLTAVTTIAAFLSVIASAGISDIKTLGILTSIGIVVTLFLTYTFVPAMLVTMPLPKPVTKSDKDDLLTRFALSVGRLTYNNSKSVFFISIFVTIAMLMGVYYLKTESSITYFFNDDNPIRVSSKFIDKKLTGTGQMSIVFKMRDRVNIKSKSARDELEKRINNYIISYSGMIKKYPQLRSSRIINHYLTSDMRKIKIDLVTYQDMLERKIKLISDMLNEDYEIENTKKIKKAVVKKKEKKTFDIASLSDDSTGDNEPGKIITSPVELGIENILERIGFNGSKSEIIRGKKFIKNIRKYKNTEIGKVFLGKFNLLSDFFITDIKQPITLRKLDRLGKKLKALKKPAAYIDGIEVSPVGKILSIADTLKIIYRVFYHDNNAKFNKIPDTAKDGFSDKSLTDRSIIGVCINQFSASSPDIFKSLATNDLKLIQFMVFMRSDKADFLDEFKNVFHRMSGDLFPKDDPYVENIVISGMPAINMTMNKLLFNQQYQSILITIIIVFLSCMFIYKSFVGGLFSIVPISFTVLINMGIMGWLDFPISYSTVVIASIAIGAGIDGTIHFMDRFKTEHIVKGKNFRDAYFSTLKTTGRAIIITTIAISGGFLVLMLSTFKMLSVSGLLVALAMILASTGAITVVPALMNWLQPNFLSDKRSNQLYENLENLECEEEFDFKIVKKVKEEFGG